MRTYEQLFIVNTAAAEADVDALLEQLSGIIKASGGNLDKTDKWGVRKLAYRVQRQSEGLYILLSFSCAAQTVRELERRLRVADLVIKFITVRMDERMKRVAKRQSIARKYRLLSAPRGMARRAVRGFARSSSASSRRLALIATVRAVIMQTTIRTSCPIFGRPFAERNVLSSANGSANTECAILMSLQKIASRFSAELDCAFGAMLAASADIISLGLADRFFAAHAQVTWCVDA